MRGLKNVNIVANRDGGETGAIPGGVLETVKSEMLQAPGYAEYNRTATFRFLELPPEIRNIIYGMLLVNPGVTYPSNKRPTSITAVERYVRYTENDNIVIPHSALALLGVNRQIHNEAYKIFYHENDLVFSNPFRLQAFMLNLGQDRLDCLRSVTIFLNDETREYEGGVTYMDAALLSLRFLRGLEKLHILAFLESDEHSHHSYGSVHHRLPGLAALFTFRNLKDVKYRHLAAEDWVSSGKQKDRDFAKRQVAAFRYLSHALQLAQKGLITRELCTVFNWAAKVTWPVLEGSDCGRDKGCSCGRIEAGGGAGDDA